jgi:hypothetical protein
VILTVYEAIYNDTSNHSLLSEFHLMGFGMKIDLTCHKDGGTQKMEIQDVGSSLVVTLELAGSVIHFKHRFQLQKNKSHSSNIARHKGILHGIRHPFLIKLQTRFTSRPLIMNKIIVLMPNLIILLALKLTYKDIQASDDI